MTYMHDIDLRNQTLRLPLRKKTCVTSSQVDRSPLLLAKQLLATQHGSQGPGTIETETPKHLKKQRRPLRVTVLQSRGWRGSLIDDIGKN